MDRGSIDDGAAIAGADRLPLEAAEALVFDPP